MFYKHLTLLGTVQNIKEVPATRVLHSCCEVIHGEKFEYRKECQKLICSTNIWVTTLSHTILGILIVYVSLYRSNMTCTQRRLAFNKR